ncbi:usherin-like, partial [Thomomys bottae]
VYQTKISFFFNGLEEDNKAYDVRTLTDTIEDFASSTIQIGQSSTGLEKFVGRMQDFRLYEVALTNREILEVFSGELPHLHTQPHCRCPGSHPRVQPFAQRYCIPNDAEDTTQNRVPRLNPEAHPLAFLNDGDMATSWVSRVFTNITHLNQGVALSLDLENGQYQVFYITVQFLSPQPTAIRIQRKKEDNSEWEDWQYFARNCSIFGMKNNGNLEHPDSVNCLQLPNLTPFSHGNFTFSLLRPGSKIRPGYNNFCNTPSLQEFVKATQIRLQFHGQYYTAETAFNLGHRYYAVNEIIITGRCQCNGHSNNCDTTSQPYRCLCSRESFTEGLQCDRCLSLYNDKPFRRGNKAQPFHCKPCQCHGHASSCHYNASVDPFPAEHGKGGGGVCEDCQHNTSGRNCELCKDYFFRDSGADPSALDVCKPCDCNKAGTSHQSLLCEKIGGQCNCKRHVSGRECNQCQNGFYNLQELESDGCSPCNCNTSGTIDGDITCHQNSGQCKCKANVIGLRCEQCNLGFKFLRSFNGDGCEPCQCNFQGSVNKFCNPLSGKCECKKGVKGLQCDTCRENFYGLDGTGCKACDCDAAGSLSGTVCDAETGQCVCKPNVGGRQCDQCLSGYFYLQHNNSFLCLPCHCDKTWMAKASLLCDSSIGQCSCKSEVTGLPCNQCEPHRHNLTMGSLYACQMCECDSLGTFFCDPISGQCLCVSNWQNRCHHCPAGFYVSPGNASGCIPCSCHIRGAVSPICNSLTGQCTCQDRSAGGKNCDQCEDQYFGFDQQTGRCQPCNCHLSGALNATCHLVTGQCFCKQFVTGSKCDICVPDASHLDVKNPWGCSKTPFQQPPPRGEVQSSSAIGLSWNPPDSPNAYWLLYNLFRDGHEIYTTEDHYPYSILYFTDTSLSPYTSYSYDIKTTSVHGSTRSMAVIYQTKPGVPEGHLNLTYIIPVNSNFVSFTWNALSNHSGPIEKYILSCAPLTSFQPCAPYEGQETSATIWNLVPFSQYNVSVQACTSGGCLYSLPITVTTAQAPPRKLSPPKIQKISSTELHAEWTPPMEPNGIIIRYELYMRRLGSTEERRVFQSNGWFNPHHEDKLMKFTSSAKENTPQPPHRTAFISGLEPYTAYEFRVLALNMAGGVSSAWITERTGESVPVFVAAPLVFPISSHSLNISWEKPADNVTRGKVVSFNITMISTQSPQQVIPVFFTQLLHTAKPEDLSYIAKGLKPFMIYNFTVSLCNAVGCVTSTSGAGQTLAAAPARLRPPVVQGLNSTTMHVQWRPPEEINGPTPMYQLERRESSLPAPGAAMTKGIRFMGNGYCKFPSTTHPLGTDFTGIKASFRTRVPNGLIVFAASPGNQEEYFALQLKNGRPYFLFDPQGLSVEVTTANDHGKQYNDGKWHEIIAIRHQAFGQITVDGLYTGSSTSRNGSTIVGDNNGVFVGGVPQSYSILREDLEITQKGFVGCLKDVHFMKNYNPSVIWEPLDWQSSEDQVNVYNSWEGCPASLQEGAHFLGSGFLELHSNTFRGGTEFEISLNFRTDQFNGLLLFTYNKDGSDYMAMELKNGVLSFRLNVNFTLTQVELSLSYCDGKWNKAIIKREGSTLSASMNELVAHTSEAGTQPVLVNSPVYLGGIPQELRYSYRHLSLQQGFGGCMKDVSFTRGAIVNLASVSSSAVTVNLDGCLSTDITGNCRGNDSILVYQGREQTVYDPGLQPFTEYLYRIRASHEGGSLFSDWSRGRTTGTAPQSVPTPSRIRSISGYKLEVTWDEPVIVRGVLEKYILKAYSEGDSRSSRLPSAQTELVSTSPLTDTGILTGLLPFRNYAVTLTACTLAGCTESSRALNISTPQEAPQEVQPPIAKSLPNSLLLSWDPPKQANGIITQYSLYMDGNLIYSGSGENFTVTDLGVFMPHQFLLSACTHVGCTNSSRVILFTAQLPPEHVDPPILTVLDSRTVYVQWKQPQKLNGILERYVLYISNHTHDFTVWNVIYNSTELFKHHVLQYLLPGNKYLIKLGACTGGGCTLSEAGEAHTDENIPEGVPVPQVHSYSPDSFNISWTEPDYPNGVITSYGLYLDGVLIHNSSDLNCHANGFAPGSLHSFQVLACTARGCALGPLVENCTLEAPPEGIVTVFVKTERAQKPCVRWEAPVRPNGRLTYSVLFTGIFYADRAGNNYTLLSGTKIMHRTEETNVWVPINELVLFTNYTIQVNASNSQGSLTSDPVILVMPPGAPDGLLPPRLSSATPTSLQVVWSTPARNNAPGSPRYQLQMRPGYSTHGFQELFPQPSASLNYEVRDLQPYMEYEFRLVASNGFGSVHSSWIPFMTAEDKPGPIDPPILLDVKSRTMSITWQRPLKSNGRISHYNLYLHGHLHQKTPGNVTRWTAVHLCPDTAYMFQVEACTSKGCSLSPESRTVWTLPGAPEGIPSPELFSDTPTSVIISWQPPTHPNGLVDNFTIERRVRGAEEVTTVVTLPRNHPMRFIDKAPVLSPWTKYEYRVLMSTVNGGTNSSAWVEVTTRPSRPAGVQPPMVQVLGSDAAKVTWKPPLLLHGDILSYEIRMHNLHLTITNVTSLELSQVIDHLIPFTNYCVTIVVCSGGHGYLGGCTESLPTCVTTHPALPQEVSPLSVIPLSDSYVAISWQPPSRPNGPNLRYELLRQKIQQPLAANPPEDLNLWHNIYSGTQWFYEDKGLSRFTTYAYKLYVHNSVGFTPSHEATATTLAGIPERGPNLTACVLNHTAIGVNWTKPSFQDLQGDVVYYTVFWSSASSDESLKIPSDINSYIIDHLNPNTEYEIFISVFNGAHSINSTKLYATTCKGEPQGMPPPEAVIINSTAVSVIWTSPSNPNGVVTEYSVYVNNKLYRTWKDAPGSFIVRGLSPFTVYDIQVEVCTSHACVKSNVTQITTVEDEPTDIPTPTIHGITSRSLQIDWASPGKPNGIILGYDLLRKAWHLCPKIQKLREDHSRDKVCKAVTCQKPEDVCGLTCYFPEAKVCCNGILYDSQPGYHCCEEKYIPFVLNSTGICCGGRIQEVQPNHKCCSGYYVKILPGEICCPDEEHNRVSVGIGDSCCGRMPYPSSGHQICCAGKLHDAQDRQCCGGQIVNGDLECCGGHEEGMVYGRLPGMFCCGQDYVNMSNTICCSASSGESKAHVKKNDPVPVKCCETELIPKHQKCCNGVGYDPLKYVCSDKISSGMKMKEMEQCGILCPVSKEAMAYCGQCDFNSTGHICALTRGPHTPHGKTSPEELCSLAEDTVHSGGIDTYSFTDVNLEPYTIYEYRISAWNSYGSGFSRAVQARTKEDIPQGVRAPRWSKIGNREDTIVLNWKKPIQPNGPIVYYILLRNGIEHFRGTSLSFSDTKGIQPFQEYSYQLRACTVAGCASSDKVVAGTTQGIPENVMPPSVTASSAEALHLSWEVPAQPNGVIKEYQLRQAGRGLIYTDATDRRQHTVTGLQPYTNYSFTLTACTSAGCASSEPFLGQTLQAAPEGVWVTPCHVIINSTAAELYWSPPEKPNGIISQYRLIRNGSVIFLGGREEQVFTDTNLEPNNRYSYKLEATSGGGSNSSDEYIVQMPAWTPEKIPPPYNITIIGSYSIFVAWTLPGHRIPQIPVEYNVLLNVGSVTPLTFSVGHSQSALLEKLSPFTQYQIRIQACQNGSCGVSSKISVTTLEAVPEDLPTPVLKVLGPSCIVIKWVPPTKPNGVILKYFLYRRPAGMEEESLLFVWLEGVLEFMDDSETLRPFTLYEYRLRAQNSKGSVDSLWSSAQTLEAPPQILLAPRARVTSAHSVLLNWMKPQAPNGIISQYRVVYQERPDDPVFNSSTVHAFTVMATQHEAHLYGLEPFTTYHVGVVAANHAGEVSSPWTLIQTLESSPSGLSEFTAEQKENGRALLLQWSEPVRTNGVLKMYNIFSDGLLEYTGLKRLFLFRRLVPFTLYTLTLEACTEAGCAHSAPQPIWTQEAPPDSQLAPTIQTVEATSIELCWSEPVNPNGKIRRYEVVRRCFEGKTGGNQTIQANKKTVFSEYSPGRKTFMYNDTDLQPWTQCEYQICAWNSAGNTCSSWSAVRTLEAPPERLSPPELSYASTNPPELLISWRPPEKSNGIMQSYKLQRNGTLYPFSFDAATFNYTDNNLLPFSTYSYSVMGCTSGGCTTSIPAHITTPEAAPSGVQPPTLCPVNANQINVSWSPPLLPNGRITHYLLRGNGEEYLARQNLSLLLSHLQPYTQYSFSLTACTCGGCTTSESKSAWTMEAPPENMDPPTLQVTGPVSIEITWKPPRNPNGQIRSYEVRRDGTIVYTGLETHYHDITLTPGMEYGYAVAASNSQGSIWSPPVKERTSPYAPLGIEPPTLHAKGPQEIRVTWDPPVRTNGDILNYTLLIRELFDRETKTTHFNTTHKSFGTRSFLVTQLKPYHRYEARIQACTILGCALSDWTSTQTLEIAPLMQPAPHLQVLMTRKGFLPIVSLWWTEPIQPNGKILYFQLLRRQKATQPESFSPVLIYNGSLSSFTDSELLPFTEYEYQVWAVNSAGKASSNWTQCRTGPAPPEGLKAPTFHAISSTQAVANISIPAKPNGNVSLYRLFSNSSGSQTVLSEGMATQQTLYNLHPFTTYFVGVEACTCFNCCSKGPTAELRTHPAPPSGLSSPQVQMLTSRTASFQWSAPLLANGVIQRYELQLYVACPPDSTLPCKSTQTETRYTGPGHRAILQGLQPYTTYKLRVLAHNEVGSTASEWNSFTTEKELPQYQAPFSVDSNLSMVWVDWSDSFLLNGRLKEYVLTDGEQRIYSGLDTMLYLPRTSDQTFIFQVTCTTDVGTVKTPLIQYDTSTGIGLVLTTAGEKKGSRGKRTAFYSELWFIILMAILGLILLAIFLSLLLQRKIRREPYIRERPPLLPLQKRMSPLSMYPPGETHTFDSVADISDVSSNVTLKSYTMHFEGLADTKLPRTETPGSVESSRSRSVLRIPSQNQLSLSYSQSSLHRSVSQLMDISDKKVLTDESLWETIMGHSRGLYVDEEDLVNAIKGFSSVTKERTAFTDTHL